MDESIESRETTLRGRKVGKTSRKGGRVKYINVLITFRKQTIKKVDPIDTQTKITYRIENQLLV